MKQMRDNLSILKMNFFRTILNKTLTKTILKGIYKLLNGWENKIKKKTYSLEERKKR